MHRQLHLVNPEERAAAQHGRRDAHARGQLGGRPLRRVLRGRRRRGQPRGSWAAPARTTAAAGMVSSLA